MPRQSRIDAPRGRSTVIITGRTPSFKNCCGGGIKGYVSRILEEDPGFRLKANIVIYNENPKSKEFVLGKTISYIDAIKYRQLLTRHPQSYVEPDKQSTAFGDFMFALGSTLGFGDNELGYKFENYTRSIRNSLRIRHRTS